MIHAQPEAVDATVYLQLKPDLHNWWKDGSDNPILQGAKVIAMTQGRPEKPKPGTVLVKVTIRTPAGAFLPLSPEAIVVIPEAMTVTTPIEVEASDPGRPTTGDDEEA